jgi:hypothetical protein
LFFYLVPASVFGMLPATFSVKLFIPENDPSPAQIVRTHFHSHFVAWQNTDIVHSHFSGDGGQYLMSIFQLHPEHSIAQGFQNYAILFDQWLFRHTIFGAAKILQCNRNKKN